MATADLGPDATDRPSTRWSPSSRTRSRTISDSRRPRRWRRWESRASGSRLPPLIDAVRDGQQYQRTQALTILKKMKPEVTKGAVPALIAAVRDGDPFVRGVRPKSWENWGRRRNRRSPLAEALEETDRSSSHAIVEVLSNLGPDAVAR